MILLRNFHMHPIGHTIQTAVAHTYTQNNMIQLNV